MKNKDRTPMEKLAGIRIELITLMPRLPEPYRSNLDVCAKWCNDLEEHMTQIDNDAETDADVSELVLFKLRDLPTLMAADVITTFLTEDDDCMSEVQEFIYDSE